MKFNNSQLEAFYTKPNPEIKAFLVFGQDEGAIREIFFKVSQMIVPDLTDAFRVAELNPLILKGNASALYDEAAAISLMGGRRLIKVDGADESVVEPLLMFLDKYDGDSFVVLCAGNLTKASSCASWRKLRRKWRLMRLMPMIKRLCGRLSRQILKKPEKLLILPLFRGWRTI